MKQIRWTAPVFFLVFSFAMAVPVWAASQDTMLDKASDWFATIGKDDSEKQMILAERRAGRAARRFEKDIAEGAHKAEKGVRKMGKEIERSLD